MIYVLVQSILEFSIAPRVSVRTLVSACLWRGRARPLCLGHPSPPSCPFLLLSGRGVPLCGAVGVTPVQSGVGRCALSFAPVVSRLGVGHPFRKFVP